MKCVVGIDVGTTSTRAFVFDEKGNVKGKSQQLNPLYEPGPVGWLECKGQDLINIFYDVTKKAIEEAYSNGVKSSDILSISFSVFRCTVITRDKDGGFITPIIMWQDIRGGEVLDYMEECLKKANMTPNDLYDICGMPMSACLPSSKLIWTMLNKPKEFEKCTRIHTTMGLITKAFGADDYYDDYTNTPWLQLNDEKMQYSDKLCNVFGIDKSKLAPLRKPGEIVGHISEEVSRETNLPVGIPIIMGIGDQQSGVLGLGCLSEDIGYACGGTAGITAIRSKNIIRDPLKKCYVLGTPDGEFEIEGQANSSASVFKWFKDNFCYDLIDENKNVYDVMIGQAKESSVGARGVLFLPYMMGANTPNYNENARGTFVGLTLSHKRYDIIRSIMEGVIFDLKDMFDSLKNANTTELKEIRITGGIARSELWNRIQADIYNKKVVTISNEEATVLGSAIIASVGAGIYKNYQEAVSNMVHIQKTYLPNKDNVLKYEKIFLMWKETYQKLAESIYDNISMYQKSLDNK